MKIEKRTKEILNDLNIRINVKGYRCWVEAVKYVIENNKTEYSMVKEIYSIVAEKTNTTASRVGRALRHSYENNNEEVQQYFGIKYQINNSTLLALIVDKIKTEMSEE